MAAAGTGRTRLAVALVAGALLGCSAVTAPPASAPDVTDRIGASGPAVAEPSPAPPAFPATTDAGTATPSAPTLVVSAPPAPVPPPPPGREALIAAAGELLGSALETADGGTLVALVTDEHGREVLAHEPDLAVLPASTLKIVTAAAVLQTYGPDATFTTRLELTGPIGPDGILAGDLVLVGGGDPVLATDEYVRWVYPARPATRLSQLADAAVEAGLRVVEGDLVATTDSFDAPTVAEGWPERYFSSFDTRFSSGLTVDAGLRTLVSWPEPEDDDEQLDPGVVDEGRADADEAEDDTDEADDQDPGPPTVRVDHARDPPQHTVDELARLLEERGVVVVGERRVGEPGTATVGRLASVSSPPMHELLRFAVQRSDNQLTDHLYRMVARTRTGSGSWDDAERTIVELLTRQGIDASQARFADGSGLSRDDRLTVRLLVDLERWQYAGRHAATWRSLMAVTGESGTLRERLSSTPASGRFHGKTGTLRDVTALVGTVDGPGARRYHLAVIANDAGAARWAARQLQDELIVLLVAELDREP